MDTSASKRALLVILVLRIVLGLAYSASNPLGEAPDEADHYAYAAYIARENRLPEGAWMTQAKHPPLYYVLAAALMPPSSRCPDCAGFLRANPDGGVLPGASPNFFIHTTLESWPWQGGALALHTGRLLSLLSALVLVTATYGLGRTIWPTQPALAVAAAGFVAFLPEALFVGASMSNDMPAAMFAGLMLLASVWQPKGIAEARIVQPLLTGALMGLGFLTKVSTVALWPVAMLAMLLNRLAGPDGGFRSSGRRQVRLPDFAGPLMAALIALLIIAPWLLRNQALYGDPLGTALVRATVDQRKAPLTIGDLTWLGRGWFFSFWGKFGGAGHLALPWPLYAFWGLLLLGAVTGWARRWVQRQRRDGDVLSTSPAGLVVLWLSPVLAALAIISYSAIALGTDQGRLLFPALAPLALLAVGGLAGWLPPSRLGQLAFGLSGVMVIVSALALLTGIVRPFSPPPEPPAAAVQAAQPVNALFGGSLELMSAEWRADSTTPPQLTLYWRLRESTHDDLRTSLRLVSADGRLLWEAKRSPAAGRYSTDRWPAGRVVADRYAPPPDLLTEAAHGEVGVRPFPEGPWLPIAGQPGDYLVLPGWQQ